MSAVLPIPRRPAARTKLISLVLLSTLALASGLPVLADEPPITQDSATESVVAIPATPAATVRLQTLTVSASADASAQGLSAPYAGGQVAQGGRAGILGTRDTLDTPFSITSYTNALIQDQQAKSVGDVLQNDAGVRVARGFGNFQESYFIRGFILSSDDVAYNGLYSLLPRQTIATELFERVEVLRGASAFLTGVTPGGDGIGGAINLLPKRAPNESLTRVTVDGLTGFDDGDPRGGGAVDVARRFGADNAFGARFNAAYRGGGSAIADEGSQLGVASLGLDWRGSDARLSGDIGYQDNRLTATRPNITLASNLPYLPSVPDAASNFAQNWSYSNERDLFGTLRGEVDFTQSITGWLAYGLRRSKEANSLANPTVTDADTGDASYYRFDNTREDRVDTGELGLRGKLASGLVAHAWVVSAARFELATKNAYGFDFLNSQTTNIYAPLQIPQPAFGANAFFGNTLADPGLTNRTTLTSYALGDTLSVLDERGQLTLGLRRQELKIENYAYNTGTPDPAYEAGRSSPMAALTIRLAKPLALYANYVEGLSQGETAPATATATPGRVLPPYVSRQKEVGLKYESRRLGANIAGFTTTRPRAVVTADDAFEASGADRHQGIETNIYGLAARGLRVLGGATWLDAEQKSTGDPAIDGKRVIGVPRFQANLGSEWDLPWLPALTLDARVVHTGDSFVDAPNTQRAPGWTRLDLGTRYALELGHRTLILRARLDNATDANYWASAGGYPGSGYLVVGAPRSLSLSAAMDF
jgi:iron complex outermembrane receptor protein